MTREEARTALATLAQASAAPTLSDDELDAALTSARLVDNDGRAPSDPDFVEENWDLNYAAAESYELKSAKLSSTAWLKKFTSENSTFEKDRPDFLALADWYRDRSTVGGTVSGQPVFVPLDNRLPQRLRPRSEMDTNDG